MGKERFSFIEKKEDFLSISIGLLLFIYISIRACVLSITHDEAITYLVFVRASLSDIVNNTLPYAANNHFLNTLLIKLSVLLFGVNEFAIRVPALCGAALYITGMYKLLSMICRGKYLVFGWLVVILNPFVLDFLSLGRGYSLGLGFFSWGLYYFTERVINNTNNRLRNEIISTTAFALSSISNLVFINVYICSIAVLTGMELLDSRNNRSPRVIVNKKKRRKTTIDRNHHNGLSRSLYRISLFSVPSGILLFLIYYRQILWMKERKSLYFGGVNGFWRDTVGSLIDSTVYGKYDYLPGMKTFIAVFIILSLLAMIYIAIHYVYRKQNITEDKILSWLLLLAATVITAIHLQKFLFDTPYLMERTAIFFIPLYLVLFMALNMSFIKCQKRYLSGIFNVVLIVGASLSVFHFANCANFNHTLTWKYDANTKKVMEYIIGQCNEHPTKGRLATIGVNWLLEPSVNYYIFTDKSAIVQPVDRSGPYGYYDYYYVTEKEKINIERSNVASLTREYKDTGTYLLSSTKR